MPTQLTQVAQTHDDSRSTLATEYRKRHGKLETQAHSISYFNALSIANSHYYSHEAVALNFID